jgi:catechol 2,3-dioxygenase-like lactoylglutathione lyase family enzyme
MSDIEARSESTVKDSSPRPVDMNPEVVVIPVSDVDRAKHFYAGLGWRLDADFARVDGSRAVQFTPWLVQEVTRRLPGRMDADTTFASSSELASALRRAAAAHGEHEKRIGQRDENWPDWYAEYIVREQSGKELPS